MLMTEILSVCNKEDLDDLLQAAKKIDKNWARWKDGTVIQNLCNTSLTEFGLVKLLLNLRRPGMLAKWQHKEEYGEAALTAVLSDWRFKDHTWQQQWLTKGEQTRFTPKEQLRLVRVLLENGADANGGYVMPVHPMIWAVKTRDQDILQALLDHGANVNGDPPNETTLITALHSGHLRTCSWLLEHGADPTVPNEHGEPTIFRPARAKRSDPLESLLWLAESVDRQKGNGNQDLLCLLKDWMAKHPKKEVKTK